MAKKEPANTARPAATTDAERAIEQFQKDMLDTIHATPAGAALVAYERYSAYIPAGGMPVGALHYSNGGNKTRT